MDERILKAYRATDYRVHAEEPFTLRIGESCVACDALMGASRAATAAFLTAWNPYSQLRSSAENTRAQEELATELAEESIATIAGEGVGRSGTWPPEPSIFALGVSRSKAVNLAQKYQQNAFVWIEHGKAAELVITA